MCPGPFKNIICFIPYIIYLSFFFVDRATDLGYPRDRRPERLHLRHARHPELPGEAQRRGHHPAHQQPPGEDRLRRRVLLVRLAPQRPRLVPGQHQPEEVARVQPGDGGQGAALRHRRLRRGPPHDAAHVAAALRPEHVGQRALQGPQGEARVQKMN